MRKILHCMDAQGKQKEDETYDMGKAGMGQREEMTEKNGCIYYHQWKEGAEIMGLQTDEEKDDHPMEDESIVDDADAGLVEKLMYVEVDSTREKKEEKKPKSEKVTKFHLRVVTPTYVCHHL